MDEIKHGFIPDEKDDRDLTFGSDNSLEAKYGGREVLCPDSDWSRWLPITEPQAEKYETNGCVSYNTLNCIEIIYKRLFNKELNLSDRFVAKGSDTNPLQGNTPRKVANFIRHNWSVFEPEYPRPDTVEEFYQTIPDSLIRLATGRGAEFDFGYETRVQHKDIREALKYSPLGISVPAWFKDNTNRYYRPEGQWDTHWCVCYGIQPNDDLLVFDSYYPYLKVLRADVVPGTIYSYSLKRQIINESWWTKFLNWLQQSLTGLRSS